MIPSLAKNFGLDGSDFVPRATERTTYVASYIDPEKNEVIRSLGGEHYGDGDSQADPEADGSPSSPTLDLGTGELLATVADAEAQATSYMQSVVRQQWNRSYKAFRNQHFDESKYNSEQYRARSKLFRPKTRTAVRARQADAAEALFATADAVTISATDDGNKLQVASAAVKEELLNYRLDRKSRAAGIPWFQISMGAHQDAQITGICASKQIWRYHEETVGTNDERMIDGTSGREIIKRTEQRKIKIDKPDIVPIAPENLLIDPAADWINPAQSAKYLIVRWPMHVSDALDMMKQNAVSQIEWMPVTASELRSMAVQPYDATNTRRAREGTQDSKDRASTGNRFAIVWLYEVFLRHGGKDWTYWTVGNSRMLSKPMETAKAHPCLGGDRPIVVGFGALDSHRLFPMSPVESWQPLQQEANDISNLRLDQMKQAVTPLAKVKRGRQVDINALQRRGPGGVLLLTDINDVEWDQPRDVPTSVFQSEAMLNADFDSIAGDFNGSSVQQDRRLNETVGGLKLLAGSANHVSNFDLRVWSETWVEPVLWQLLKLEEYYENDEVLLALAGNRAQLYERFGVSEITDQLLLMEVSLKVSAGTGSSGNDPMQALTKFKAAAEVCGEVLMPFIQSGQVQVTPDPEAIVNEVFGKAGYKDGGERFFKFPQPGQTPQPMPQNPALVAKAQSIQQQTQMKGQESQARLAAIQQKTQLDGQSAMAKIAAIQAQTKARQAHDAVAVHSAVQQAHAAGQPDNVGETVDKLTAKVRLLELAAKVQNIGKDDNGKGKAPTGTAEVLSEIKKALKELTPEFTD